MGGRVGRLPKEAGRDTRADLLSAAIDLFSRDGFRAIDLRTIADRAGVSLGLIRHHFGVKEELIEAATECVVHDLRLAFQAMVANLDAQGGIDLVDRLAERSRLHLFANRRLLFYLRHLTIERPDASLPVFRHYFTLIQAELMPLEAAGELGVDVNRVWLTFLLMFMHLGPVFLDDQIRAIIGRDQFEPSVLQEKTTSMSRILKFGMLGLSSMPQGEALIEKPARARRAKGAKPRKLAQADT